MSPSRSACPWRILKISSCLRRPLNPWTPSSLATLFRSVMVLSLSSDRFILLPPPPPFVSRTAGRGLQPTSAECAWGYAARWWSPGGVSVRANCIRGMFELRYSVQSVIRVPALSTSFCGARAASTRVRRSPLASHPDVDDGSLPYLGEPFLHPASYFWRIQDVADLVPRLDQRLAGERFLGVQTEQVVADLGPERGGIPDPAEA